MLWKVWAWNVEPILIEANSFDECIDKARCIDRAYCMAQIQEV